MPHLCHIFAIRAFGTRAMPFADLDTWDLVLWVVLALVALNLFGRVMLRFREVWLNRYRQQIDMVQQLAKRGQEGREAPTDAT